MKPPSEAAAPEASTTPPDDLPPAAPSPPPSRHPWARFKAFLEKVAGMNESPHELALGLGIGIFVGFLPCMGVQTWVALPLAMLFGGNKALAVAGVWISNPVTFVPFYYTCYWVGLLVYQPEVPFGFEQFRALIEHGELGKLLEIGNSLVVPLTVGSLVLGIPAGILTYFALYGYLQRKRGRAA